jgi:hypothetical protein
MNLVCESGRGVSYMWVKLPVKEEAVIEEEWVGRSMKQVRREINMRIYHVRDLGMCVRIT